MARFYEAASNFYPVRMTAVKYFYLYGLAARPYSQNEREKGYQEEWKSQTPFDILNSLVWSSFAGEF